MRYSLASGMILAAMTIGETVAGPTHAHLHRRVHEHEKKDINYATVDYSGVDFAKAYSEGVAEKAPGTAQPAAATPTAAGGKVSSVAASPSAASPSAAHSSAATQSSASSSAAYSSSSSSSSSSGLWKSVVGVSNSRKAFGPGIAPVGTPGDNYFGNYGGKGDDYGSNVILVDSVGSNQFTNTFKNSQSQPITVNVWNKVGPDFQVLSGSALAPTKTTLTFVLAPGGSQTVAFQDVSNIGWAEATDKTTGSGAFQTTWGEANFVSGGSGYDVSAINNPNNDYHMTITSVESPSCTSDITQNYWKTATDPIGMLDGTDTDGSCYVPGTSMHLTTTMGG